ncbi:hypothetical protein ICN84_02980 [Akkermansia glycaniphila]|uniref:hypothetical protein n=1 Tax=Akkermansia glycaniphila TaxID=1679444 RepID=UPI001C011744|nr:hypothetical protein [Akkermansia glycaniphila]MBT9449035.1 hypothetical protein [Akkermansia glycaniphila]
MRTCLGMFLLALVVLFAGGTIVYQTYTNSGIKFEQKERHSEFTNPKGKPKKNAKPAATPSAPAAAPALEAPIAPAVEEPPIAEPVPE